MQTQKGSDRNLLGLTWVRVCVGVLLAGLCIYASIRVVRHQAEGGTGDFGVYYRTGLAMRLRQPIYTLDHGPLLTFKNPPVVALLIAPFTVFPIGIVRWLWLVGDLTCLYVTYRLASRVIFTDATPGGKRCLVVGGAILLSSTYIFDQIFAGSTSMYYLVLTVASFVWAFERKGARAGVALAVAICLKIVPLAFVPWLWIGTRTKRSFAALILTLVVLAFLPTVWIGPGKNLRLLEQWPGHLVGTENREQESRRQNQSLRAMLTRFLTETPVRPNEPKEFHVNFAKLSAHAVTVIWFAISVTAAIGIYTWIFYSTTKDKVPAGAALSLLLIFMTVCNPLAWRYNFVALGIPYLYVLFSISRQSRLSPAVITLVAISCFSHFGTDYMQSLSARFWGAIALAGAVGLCAAAEINSPASATRNQQSTP